MLKEGRNGAHDEVNHHRNRHDKINQHEGLQAIASQHSHLYDQAIHQKIKIEYSYC
jgi:hypothetical protein